jgi:Flp pilus assembly protein TadG
MSLSRSRVSRRPARVSPIGVGSARRRGRERGAAAVELALLTPVLLLFVLGIIDFGRLWYTQISLSQAAREGARLEATGSTQVYLSTVSAATGINASDMTVYVNNTTVTSTSPAVACQTDPTKPTDATVRVTYRFTFILGSLAGLGPKTLAGKGVMPCGG